jgi:ketosteroid isomerase-like protein
MASAFEFEAFRAAVESGDAEGWSALYAPDAEWIEYRHGEGPGNPNRIAGRELIAAFIAGVCSAGLGLEISNEVVAAERVAFRLDVRLPDGRVVIEHVILELSEDGIARQTDVEAWEPPPGPPVEDWLRRYGEAWERRDGEAAAALFTPDALYAWGPWEQLRGREAIAARWQQATADQGRARFEARPIGRAGEHEVVHWGCALGGPGDGHEIDGVFLLRFAPDGLCEELREWWAVRSHPS